jgi:transposase InsO family protein
VLARREDPVLRDLPDLPACSTIHAILARHGCVDPAQERKHRPWQRFEHDRPNALWQLDFKGHVPLHRDGQRCHPLTVLDDHSRYAIGLWACGNERRDTVQAHLIEAFRRYGLPERVLCDNGPPWGVACMRHRHTRLTVWLLRLGVRTSHGSVCHPQTQGKDERFHRTLKAELLSRLDLRDLRQAQAAFDRWRGTYNLIRPHEALAMQVPASRYTPSARAYPETLPPLEYASGQTLRRVAHDGSIRFGGRTWPVGEAFAGERVAVRPPSASAEGGVMEICYGPHPVALINPE